LEQLLDRREMRDAIGLSVSDHQLGAARQDRLEQALDVGRPVLVVGVGVDDDVSAELHAGVDARHEGPGQTAILRKAHHVMHAELDGALRRSVGAAVVDDQHLDLVDARDASRQRSDGLG
jgi:hypothetical protein